MLHLAILACCASVPCASADVVLDTRGFEDEVVGRPPAGWTPFHSGSMPSVDVVNGGAGGSGQCVRGSRSASGGWTSLSREMSSPQRRIMIEFSFAFSDTSGRSLNVWTHEPGGQDASQLNICIQNGALMQFDGRTRSWEVVTREIQPSDDPTQPVWHRLRAVVDAHQPGIDFWISEPNATEFPASPITRAVYRTDLELGAIDLVSGQRIAEGSWYLIDDLITIGGDDLPAPHAPEPLAEPFPLWTGPAIPADVEQIPFVAGVQHHTVHQARADGYKFLHGAAIIHHHDALFAHWANSPVNENGPHETLQGRRSFDGGRSWSELEVIAAGFEGAERHSHGVFLEHEGELWTFCSRFGRGTVGRRFPGLVAEAFVLDEQADRWESRGVVMENCWPYDEPVRMSNGNYITGGQDRDGLPVVAVSDGDNLLQWDSIRIPFETRLQPGFAETTVWADANRVLAVIRGGSGVAWVSISEDYGRNWSTAGPSNYPMPRAKAYLGRLSTGQLYLVSNRDNRDTLVISVGDVGGQTLNRTWRIRHGPSEPPRFPGRAKGKQWSYPYAHEHDGRLYVVYSIGKEDCGLSVIPIESLQP